MKIELELEDREAEAFIVARTKDVNVAKYAEAEKAETFKNEVMTSIYEVIADFEIRRAAEIKKAQMMQWIQGKQNVNKVSKSDN